jgi:hypothetical protein
MINRTLQRSPTCRPDSRLRAYAQQEEVSASSDRTVNDTKSKTPAGLFPATVPGNSSRVELNHAGMRVTYGRNIRRITLQRYLVSKMVWQPDRVTFPELLALYDNQLWLEDKASKDPGFLSKFGGFLENLSVLLKGTRITYKTLTPSLRRLSTELRVAAEGHLIPERNLITTEMHVKGRFHVTPTKESGIPTRELPPVKVIGKGYRDKGTYRDPAWDGSPSWQELATYFSWYGHEKDTD